MRFVFLILLVYCFLFSSLLTGCEAGRGAATTVRESTVDTLHLDHRAATITFILGEDTGDDAYYTRAGEYFRYHPEESGDYLITDLRSIRAVRHYLRQHQPVVGAWQKINLVAHGNQWNGLAVPLQLQGAERTSTELLAAWTPARPLPKNHVNEATEIIVHGYSAGQDSALLLQLSRVFAARGDRFPAVSASARVTRFREGEYGMERYYAGYNISVLPHGGYPEKSADRNEVQANSCVAEVARSASYWLTVPISWTRTYPKQTTAQLPASGKDWLAAEPKLLAKLQRMGLTADQFRWEFDDRDYPLADGGHLPAVTARGIAKLLCVLLPADGNAKMVRLRYSI